VDEESRKGKLTMGIGEDTIPVKVHRGEDMEKLSLVLRQTIMLFYPIAVITPSHLDTTAKLFRDVR
jgi:hypothetical protein